MKKKDYIIAAMIAVTLGVLIWLNIISWANLTKERQSSSYQITHTIIKDTMAFQDSILNVIFNMRLEHPYIVYSQILIESGYFSSIIFKENNNFLGMKMPERRATLAIGINKGHSIYRTWKECLIDYGLYQMAYLRGLSEEEYFQKIGAMYAEDVNYEHKVRSLMSKL